MAAVDGIVRETRQSRLAEEIRQAMGASFDPAAEDLALPEGTVLPNPLRVVPEILSQSRHVRTNHIHGDLNLENVLVDPQVRDVRLIDFADARWDHVLLDYLRLEAEVVTKLLPAALVEAQLPPTVIALLYGQLHHAVFEPGRDRAGRMPHPALEKPFAILSAIRRAAYEGLYDRDDPDEYYRCLILVLLGTCKFDALDTVPEAPLPKQLAFLGAATLQQLVWPECAALVPTHVSTPVAVSSASRETAVASKTPSQPAASGGESRVTPARPSRSASVRLVLTGVVAIALILAWVFWPPPPVPPLDSSRLCAIEEQLAIPIAIDQPSRYAGLLSYYQEANRALFDHLDAIARQYDAGQAHRGATYVIGGPGVGKSYVASALDQFPDQDRCTIRMGEFAVSGGQGIAFTMLADLATLEGELTFNQLPAIADPAAFSLQGLLAAGGCVREGQIAPLVTIDDLNEVHDESIWLILREIEGFISQDPAADSSVHILVFGRPEAFAPWLRQYRRTPPRALSVSQPLEGATYATSGDLDLTYRDYLDYRRMPAPEPQEVEDFCQLVAEHPFLTYSLRILAVRNYVIEASRSHIVAEQELKTTIYNSLIERDRQVHGRASAYPQSYGYLLEDIAARYLAHVDDRGYFAVGARDRISVYDERREHVIGEVYVRDVLDRSGIARFEHPDFALVRYRFDPFWMHAHLIELRNVSLHPGYAYRTCAQLTGSDSSPAATPAPAHVP